MRLEDVRQFQMALIQAKVPMQSFPKVIFLSQADFEMLGREVAFHLNLDKAFDPVLTCRPFKYHGFWFDSTLNLPGYHPAREEAARSICFNQEIPK